MEIIENGENVPEKIQNTMTPVGLPSQLGLQAFGWAKQLGLLEQPWGRKLFVSSYFFYKRVFEDPFAALVRARPELFIHGNILDIGANIGYTSLVFSRALHPGCSVYAFEPDDVNFAMLTRTIQTQKLQDKVIPIQAAVGEENGEVELWHNSAHHGDHRIVTDTFRDVVQTSDRVYTVPCVSIDNCLATRPEMSPVSFIKIDVQGYELLVCQGMEETLVRNPQTVVAFEYHPPSLRALGFKPESLLDFFCDRSYQLYLVSSRGVLTQVEKLRLDEWVDTRGYLDVLASKKG